MLRKRFQNRDAFVAQFVNYGKNIHSVVRYNRQVGTNLWMLYIFPIRRVQCYIHGNCFICMFGESSYA